MADELPSGSPPPAAPPGGAPPAAAPPASAPAWDAGIFDSSKPGAFVEGWAGKAPDPAKFAPYAGAKSFGEFADIAETRLAEAQTALRNKANGGLPQRPAADAAPELWSHYREAHGLPQTPDDYSIEQTKGLAPELWDAPRVGEFKTLAHDLDLPQDKVQKLLDWYHGGLQEQVAGIQKGQAETHQKMVQAEAVQMAALWGDKVNAKLSDMQTMSKAFKGEPDWFNPSSEKFAGVPFAEFMSNVFARLPRGEGSTLPNMGAPTPNGQYDMKWAEAAQVKGHPDYEAMSNPRHPRHQEVHALWNQAIAMAKQG